MMLRPFFPYFGSKWRKACLYPEPEHEIVIEPFAGSAGYALHYADRQVVLIEKYPVVAEVWRFLIGTTPREVRRIPLVTSTLDLPGWVPEGACRLVGYHLNPGNARSCVNLSASRGEDQGWTEAARERVATQVTAIKHWTILEGDYRRAPNVEATWFVDPPYFHKGYAYNHGSKGLDYTLLGEWCRSRRGLTIACEGPGAEWLPFRFFTHTSNINARNSKEFVWIKRANPKPEDQRFQALVAMIGLQKATRILRAA